MLALVVRLELTSLPWYRSLARNPCCLLQQYVLTPTPPPPHNRYVFAGHELPLSSACCPFAKTLPNAARTLALNPTRSFPSAHCPASSAPTPPPPSPPALCAASAPPPDPSTAPRWTTVAPPDGVCTTVDESLCTTVADASDGKAPSSGDARKPPVLVVAEGGEGMGEVGGGEEGREVRARSLLAAPEGISRAASSCSTSWILDLRTPYKWGEVGV